MIQTLEFRPGQKYIYIYTRLARYRIKRSFPDILSVSQVQHLGRLLHISPVSLSLALGLASLVGFNLFVRRRHPVHPAIIDSGWKSSLAAFQRVVACR